jgi:D-glycero-alpha-D-manno-heptose-7-phosphate kinase
MNNTSLKIVRSPLRLSFFGGGSDLPEFIEHHSSYILSMAIDKYVTVAIKSNFSDNYRVAYSKIETVINPTDINHDLIRNCLINFNVNSGTEIVTFADVPGEGTGLGSSSALCVGMVKALSPNQSQTALAEKAYYIERELAGHPVGKQDHYASACGGFKLYRFSKNVVEVRDTLIDTETINGFIGNILLLHTGITRSANPILKDVSHIANHLLAHQLCDYAQLGVEAVRSGMWSLFGQYLSLAWEIKKQMSTMISNPAIDSCITRGIDAGAYGAKLCGAGGGGFILFFAHPSKHDGIIANTGLKRLPVGISWEGSQIIYG